MSAFNGFNDDNFPSTAITFPGGFADSPFGEFWETGIYTNEEVDVKDGSGIIKYQIAVSDNADSIRDKYKSQTVADNAIRVYLIVNDKTPINYSEKNDLRNVGIRFSNILEYVGVVLGDAIYDNIKDNKGKQEEYISRYVRAFVENASQEKMVQAILNEKFTYYMNNKRSSLITIGLIGRLIQRELKNDLQQVWKPILSSLANEIRSYKFDDEKYWQPYLEEGSLKSGEEFTPFIGDNVRDIQEFSNSFFNKIDVAINNHFKFNDTSQSLLESALEKIFTIFKDVLKVFKDGILTIIKNMADRLYELNAFLVGIVNGSLELIAGLVDLVALTAGLVSGEDAEILWQTILSEIEIIKEKGGFAYIIEKLNDLFESIDNRYDATQSKYLILKNLGEDIFSIIELVIGAAALFKAGKLVLQAAERGFNAFKNKIDDIFVKHSDDFDSLINVRAASYLDKVDYEKFLKQQKSIEDVETGKKRIDTGEKPDGTVRSDKDHTLSGNYGEMKVDQFMINQKQRWKPLHDMIDDIDKKYPPGIDGIYQNLDFVPPPPPPKYIVAEAKYSPKGTNGLSTRLTKDGLQMSDDWIEKRLIDFIDDEEEFFDILSNYESVLFKINKEGDVMPFKLSQGSEPKIIKENLNYLL